MPTVDELIVELKLDPSQFTAGQKEAISQFERTRRSFETEGKKVNESVAKNVEGIYSLSKAALALFGVFTTATGAKDFVKQMTEANASLGRLGENLKASPQDLRAWGAAAEQLGGDGSATVQSFQKLADMVEGLKTQGQALPAAFYQIQAISGQTIDLSHGIEKTFTDLSKALAKIYETDPQKADFLGRQLGLDPDTVNMMERNGGRIGDVIDKLKKIGPSDDDVKKSQELQKSWAGLSQSAESFGRVIVNEISPGLKAAADATKTLIDMAREEHERQEKMTPAEGAAARKANADSFWQFFGFGHAPKALDEGVTRDSFMHWLSGLGIGGAKAATAGGPNLNPLGLSAGEFDDMRGGSDREAGRARALSGLASGDVSVQGHPVTTGNPLPVTPVTPQGAAPGGFWDSVASWFSSGTSSAGAGFPGPTQGPPAPAPAPSGGGGGWWPHLFGGGGSAPAAPPRAGGGGGPFAGRPGTTGAGDGGGSSKPGEILDWFASTFGLTKEQALGPVGFMGFESGDFKQMHQMGAPLDTGDFGYPQYSGPRRVAMESWVHTNMPGVDPASDKAQKAYLEYDLVNNYPALLAKLRSQPAHDQTFETWARDYEMGSPWYDRDPVTVGMHRAKMEQYKRKYLDAPAPAAPAAPRTGPVSRLDDKWAHDWSRMSVASRNALIGPSGATTTSNHTSHEMNIANLTVQTHATDAAGIARDIHSALEDQMLAARGNFGIA